MTSINFKVFLTNLTQSQKPSYWRFMESLKCTAEEGDRFLPKNCSPENVKMRKINGK